MGKPNEGGQIQFPNKNDVLSGRGGRINNHEGNINFRTLVSKVKLQYLSRQTKKPDKAVIAANIVDQIRKMDPPGRFLKEDPDTGLWREVGDERARRKTGQALREDAPEIKGEMMVIEEEVNRTRLTNLVMMSGQMPYDPMMSGPYPPAMPFPPIYYPPAPAMCYPQMYPPPQYPGQYAMPQTPMAQTPLIPPPFPAPIMTPYMYPTPIYPPLVATSATPAQQPTQTQQSNPTTACSDVSSATKKQEKNHSSEVASVDAVKTPLNQEKESSKQPVETSNKKIEESQAIKNDDSSISKQKRLHLDSNNSSQTDITVNSSTLSDATEMSVDIYEYEENMQVPIKNDPKPSENRSPLPSKRSRRSQWRESLKKDSSDFFKQQPTIDDLPKVIATTNNMEENEDEYNNKYLNFNDRRSSSSLPEAFVTSNNIEENEERRKLMKFSDRRSSSSLPESSATIYLSEEKDEDITSYRKSLSMTDFDVIETLASMSYSG